MGNSDVVREFIFFRRNRRIGGNSAAKVVAVMKEAGFADAAKVGRWKRLVGSVAYYKAKA